MKGLCQPVRSASYQYRCHEWSSLDMQSAASQLANIMSDCLLCVAGFDAATSLSVLTMTRYSAVRDGVNKSSDSRTQGHEDGHVCAGGVPTASHHGPVTACCSCMFGKYRTELLARVSLT